MFTAIVIFHPFLLFEIFPIPLIEAKGALKTGLAKTALN
jgi:hypothetical protein